MTVSENSGYNQLPDPDTLWCTWPADWPIIDELHIGAKTGVAVFDIGHVGVNAEPYLTFLKTTRAWHEAGLIFLVDRENVGALRRELLHDDRLHLWDSAVHDHDRFHTYIPWFDWALRADTHLGLTDRLTDPLINEPQYLFDCIMGIKRPHRDYLYEQIHNCADIKARTFLNYLGQGHCYVPGAERDTAEGSGVASAADMNPGIWQDDMQAATSIIIPYKIYNQSWFSLTVESRPYNNRLITEKLAKPLLSQRVFVLFGAQHHLRDLRRLGFQTFAPVIDESYDEIEDCKTRWAAAWEAARDIARRDPQQIWRELQPRAHHNQQVARRMNWWAIMNSQMREIVHKYRMEKSL
jgi:hypothetical protein